MKRLTGFRYQFTLGSLALAAAVLLGWPTAAVAQKKGAELMMQQLQPIRTAAEAEAVEPGDLVIMSCPKCKSSWATIVEKPIKASQSAEGKVVEQHACPGCGTTIQTVGQGKANKKEKIVHRCRECGSKNAFCCVLKKGSLPTPGMAPR